MTTLGLLVIGSILLFATVADFQPTDGAVAPRMQIAALAGVVLGPLAVAVTLLWWGRQARARRAAEDVALAGWPIDRATRYREDRAVEAWRARAFVVFLGAVPLILSGGLIETFHAYHLRAPLGLATVARLGRLPGLLGILLLFGGVAALGVVSLINLVMLRVRMSRAAPTEPAPPQLVLPPPRRRRRGG